MTFTISSIHSHIGESKRIGKVRFPLLESGTLKQLLPYVTYYWLPETELVYPHGIVFRNKTVKSASDVARAFQ